MFTAICSAIALFGSGAAIGTMATTTGVAVGSATTLVSCLSGVAVGLGTAYVISNSGKK